MRKYDLHKKSRSWSWSYDCFAFQYRYVRSIVEMEDRLVRHSWTQDRTLGSWKLWTYIINVMIRELLFPWLYEIFNLFDPFSFCWCQLCWFQRFLWLGCYGVYHLGKTMICLNFCLKIVMSKWERRFYTVEKFW